MNKAPFSASWPERLPRISCPLTAVSEPSGHGAPSEKRPTILEWSLGATLQSPGLCLEPRGSQNSEASPEALCYIREVTQLLSHGLTQARATSSQCRA